MSVIDTGLPGRRQRQVVDMRDTAIVGHRNCAVAHNLAGRRTILSRGSEPGWWRAFSRYAFAIGGNRNHAPPRQLSLVITSKFVFCRLRITERTTRDWRVRPMCSLSKGELR